ncbi:hypothetical protein FGF1_29190 [Flavobacteriaceae bacterium GF1]
MKVLVPFDFSEEAKHALRFGNELSSQLNLELKVLHALGLSDFPYYKTNALDTIPDKVEKAANHELKTVLTDELGGVDRVHFEIGHKGATREILKTMRTEEISFTVLGYKDFEVPEKVGSTTKDILRHAEGSVLCLKKPLSLSHVKTVLFVSDFQNTPTKAMGNIKKLVKAAGASLRFLYVNSRANWLSTNEVLSRFYQFCSVHDIVDREIEIVNEETVDMGVVHYVNRNPVDIIGLKIGRESSKIDMAHAHLSAERILSHTDIPLLTYAHESRYL